ncbi:Bug family tripartite tricarboxylate transporter substrate binding protein [Devosia sp.]|uniref:Bug family tripartite tricarboxylate transporter substrate binding protein n=1 Tax=Devosia sp. TaxID=1871048 RepID=UPI002FC5F721
MLKLNRRAVVALGLAAALGSTAPVFAQSDYPNKPITLVVSYAAGGGTDAIARLFAARLEQALGGRVIVENRPGAAANIGTEVVAEAEPDGYTLLIGNQGPMVVNPHLFELPADPAEALDPIAMIADASLVVVVGPKQPVATLGELVETAKTGQLVYGSAGNASASHLASVLFGQTAGVDIRHVPYQGAGPAVNDLVGGHIDFMITTIPSVIGLVQDSTLKALAVTGSERFTQLPDVPTAQEAGVEGYTASAWYGLLGPKGLPEDVRQRLADATAEVLADPAFLEKLANDGGVPSTLVGADFAAYMVQERARWGEVVAAAEISVE